MMKTECAGRWLPFFLCAFLFFASCGAVKEDRRNCPCTLSVVMQDLPEYPAWLYVNGTPAGTAQTDTTLAVWVDKGSEALVQAFSGAAPGEDGLIRIPYGSTSPPLYTFYGWADCSGETGSLEVCMRRQFCVLHLEVDGPGDWGDPYWVEVRGCSAGLDPADGTPLSGDFHCRLDREYRCRLPRQRSDDPLWLDIAMADGVIRSFPLGEYLQASAYDWEAPDLQDIHLLVNLSISEISFTWDLWTTVIPMDLVI